MRKLHIFIILFMTLNSAVSLATELNIPEKIRCTPVEFYSGGYDFYEILTEYIENAKIYKGLWFYQKTTGHGNKSGNPILKNTVIIKIQKINNELIELKGFQNSNNQKDTIFLPMNWDGNKILVISELFDNDVKSDGFCRKFL